MALTTHRTRALAPIGAHQLTSKVPRPTLVSAAAKRPQTNPVRLVQTAAGPAAYQDAPVTAFQSVWASNPYISSQKGILEQPQLHREGTDLVRTWRSVSGDASVPADARPAGIRGCGSGQGLPASARLRVAHGLSQAKNVKPGGGRTEQQDAASVHYTQPQPQPAAHGARTATDAQTFSQQSKSDANAELNKWMGSNEVFVGMVFDGHGKDGARAPALAKEMTLRHLSRNNVLASAVSVSSQSGSSSGSDAEDPSSLTGASSAAIASAIAALNNEDFLALHAGIARTFAELDRSIIKDAEEWNYETGSTALVYIIADKLLVSSNAGDSRAVLARDGRALRLSRDHTPTDPDEEARIRAAAAAHAAKAAAAAGSSGGSSYSSDSRALSQVINKERGRICVIKDYMQHSTNVSRAFGDRLFKQYGLSVSTPDVSATFLHPERDAFMIAASDGLWCVLDDAEAVAVVAGVLAECRATVRGAEGAGMTSMSASGDDSEMECAAMTCAQVAEAASARLVALAKEKGSVDDITVIVNVFDWHV